MKRLVATTLLGVAALPASLLFTQPATAETYTACYPVTQPNIIRNPADHPDAYTDGYSEGRQSRRNGDVYKPRTAGGEFSRGFEDGYFGRRFSGQKYAVRDRIEYNTTQQCNTYTVPDRDWRRQPFRSRAWYRW